MDSQPFFKGSRVEIFPGQKWSISNLWEHFLVSEHRRETVLIDFVAGRSLKYSLNGSLTKKTLKSLVKINNNSPNPYFYNVTQAFGTLW